MSTTKTVDSHELAIQTGKRILGLLIERDLTQSQLADALGLNKSSVSAWIHGKRLPRLSTVDAMCRYFHVERSAILGDNGVPQLSDQMRDEINRLVDERLQAAGTTQNQSEQFYDNETVQIVTDRLRKNPEYAVLFKAASNLKPEDVDFVVQLIEKMS